MRRSGIEEGLMFLKDSDGVHRKEHLENARKFDPTSPTNDSSSESGANSEPVASTSTSTSFSCPVCPSVLEHEIFHCDSPHDTSADATITESAMQEDKEGSERVKDKGKGRLRE